MEIGLAALLGRFNVASPSPLQTIALVFAYVHFSVDKVKNDID